MAKNLVQDSFCFERTLSRRTLINAVLEINDIFVFRKIDIQVFCPAQDHERITIHNAVMIT